MDYDPKVILAGTFHAEKHGLVPASAINQLPKGHVCKGGMQLRRCINYFSELLKQPVKAVRVALRHFCEKQVDNDI